MALQAFSLACNAVTEAEAEQLSQLVSQPEFIECLRKLWRKLPKETKKKIYKSNSHKSNSHPRQRPRPRRPRARPRHLPITHKIVIPAEDHANITQWLRNHDQFFDDDNNNDNNNNDDDDDDGEIARRCPISRIYRAVVQAEFRHSGDNLRLRFFKVLFFHLKVRSGVERLRDNSIEDIARVINSAINVDVDQIADNIRSWAKIGKRYDGLCQDLAKLCPSELSESEDQSTLRSSDAGDYKKYVYLGPLFYLPSEVTERWLKDLPESGKRRDDTIKMFLDRGIFEIDNKRTIDTLVGHLFCEAWVEMKGAMKDYWNHSFDTHDEWRTQKPMPEFQVRRASVRDIVSPSSASVMSTDDELAISKSNQCLLSDTLVTAQVRASSLMIGRSPEQQACPSEDMVLRSTRTSPIDGETIIPDTGARALSGTLVGSSTHSPSPNTGSPAHQESSSEDLPSSTSPIDEETIIPDTGTRASSGALLVSQAHSSPPGFVYQDSPQGITWDSDTSLERPYRLYNCSSTVYSSGHPSHDPDSGADRSMFNGWDGFHQLDVDEHGQPGYHYFDPSSLGMGTMPTESTERGISGLGQFGFDGFHHLDVDEHGQPGYHYFDPSSLGMGTMPTESTERGISGLGQFGFDGFHHLDVDEHGQPGYHYFDPSLFGLPAIQDEQPAVAISTSQNNDLVPPCQDHIISDLIRSMLPAGGSTLAFNTPAHHPYTCAHGLLQRCHLATTMQNALSLWQDQSARRCLLSQRPRWV